MASKITLSIKEEEAKHFSELAESLNLKKTELFRRALALYEDYMYLYEVEKRSADVKEGRTELLTYQELEKAVYAD